MFNVNVTHMCRLYDRNYSKFRVHDEDSPHGDCPHPCLYGCVRACFRFLFFSCSLPGTLLFRSCLSRGLFKANRDNSMDAISCPSGVPLWTP